MQVTGSVVLIGSSTGANSTQVQGTTASGSAYVGNPLVAGAVGSSLAVTILRTPDKVFSVSATASGNTAIWTPAAGKKFRLMKFLAGITGNSTQTVAGNITLQLRDGASTVLVQWLAFVNSAALNVTGDNTLDTFDMGNGLLSSTANNVLNLNLSTALTAGSFWVIVAGVEE